MDFEKLLKRVSFLGLISVPMGPLFYFGFEVYLDTYGRLIQVLDPAVAAWAAGLLGFLAGLGLESVGIISGHMAITFWGKGQTKYLLAALASGGFYILVGMLQLADAEQGLALAQTLFLIALPTYVLAGLLGLDERNEADVIAQNEQVAAQSERNNEHQRKLEMIAAEAAAQAELIAAQAAAEAKVTAAQAKVAAAQAKMSKKVSANEQPVSTQMSTQMSANGHSGKRRNELTLSDWIQVQQLSSAEVASLFGTSPSTARRWRAEADDEIRLLSSNGHAVAEAG